MFHSTASLVLRYPSLLRMIINEIKARTLRVNFSMLREMEKSSVEVAFLFSDPPLLATSHCTCLAFSIRVLLCRVQHCRSSLTSILPSPLCWVCFVHSILYQLIRNSPVSVCAYLYTNMAVPQSHIRSLTSNYPGRFLSGLVDIKWL